MEQYQIAQELLAVASVYGVSRPGSKTTEYLISGAFATLFPQFDLVRGDDPDGDVIGQLRGNSLKTKYEVLGTDQRVLGSMRFPAAAIKKTLKLEVRVGEGVVSYAADGGIFKGIYQCKDESGETVLEIVKKFGIRDTFDVQFKLTMPLEVALFTAVAIHSRYYELT